MKSEIQDRASFDLIRYAQCWEDADMLLQGLNPRPGGVYVSIASAGDNSFALLTTAPARVLAIDLNPAQIHCVALRAAMYRELEHGEFLELYGSRPSNRRAALYQRCRPLLSADTQAFWDARPDDIAAGIGGAGKFEHYFRLFRERALPWVHGPKRVAQLLQGGDLKTRRNFYQKTWDTLRWRMMYKLFFSRRMLGRKGRDPEFFKYVQGSVAERLLARTEHALTQLNPADNPYLHWILTGTHGQALPCALRAEHYDTIRAHLDRLSWSVEPVEAVLDRLEVPVDGYNLSDIFEYMSASNYETLLRRLIGAGRVGTRLVYWNMMVPRFRPTVLAGRLEPVGALGDELLMQDKAFFYTALRVEEVV